MKNLQKKRNENNQLEYKNYKNLNSDKTLKNTPFQSNS